MSGRVLQEHLERMQQNPNFIRHICVLAHVDHGKTSLSDSLIASNAIISQRLAGKVRYLDSREDEQQRGITMKSSLISLLHITDEKPYLINLIDSPGHVDFSSEVSTAVRLCDGALVIVDVSEGVCAQTHAVLRQAYEENIRPVLILNKVDRLITELKLTPDEALVHLQKILEHVNAVMATLFTGEFFQKDAAEGAHEGTESQGHSVDVDDESLYFEPEKENVVFASAQDGWAFGIRQFADTFAQKLNCNQSVLMKTLWGDFYYNPSTKKIMKGAHAKNKKPLFVQFVLESLWAVYNSVYDGDTEKAEKIATSLKVKVLPRVLKGESRVLLQTLMGGWLPLPQAVLDMVARQIPSPLELPDDRKSQLYYGGAEPKTFPILTQQMYDYLSLNTKLGDLPRDAEHGNAEPLLAYVSKMESFDWDVLPQNQAKSLTQEQMASKRAQLIEKMKLADAEHVPDEGTETTPIGKNQTDSEEKDTATALTDQDKQLMGLIGFTRIYCGKLSVGDSIYVLGPKHSPNNPVDSAQCAKVAITELYIVMGKDLMSVDCVTAGNICGVGGLAKHVYKNATLASSPLAPALFSMNSNEAPIVRVAVEAFKVSDMPKLVEGLRMLNQSDSMVQVSFTDKGEHILHTAGEVHLERCLKDLRERYARVQIRVSAPVVPFRETVVPRPRTDMVNESHNADTNAGVVLMSKQDQLDILLAPSANKGVVTTGEENDEDVTTDKVSSVEKRNSMEIGEGDEGEGVYVNVSPDGSVRVRVRALPLPPQVGAVIDEYSDKLRRLGAGAVDDLGHESSSGSEWRQRLYDRLQRAFLSASQGKQRATTQQDTPNTDTEETNESGWEAFQVDEPIRQVYAMCARNLWAFGPKNCGPNVLVNGIPWYSRDGSAAGGEDEELEVKRGIVAKLDSSIVNGFQNATANGPLCEEPMRCVLFVVENIWMSPALLDRARTGEKPKGRGEGADNDFTPMHCTGELSDALESTASDNGANLDPKTLSKGSSLGAVIGQMVSVVKETCRKAFIASHPRLMYAQYACDIQAPAEVLGKVYAVVSKREGVVLSENMKEGSDIFTIKCLLPVRNSFGFADEIRKRTSGAAFPQLVFSHWETIPVNPFWIPTTVEELLHYGEIADTVNLAMKLMNDVRKRKGLRVKEKLVEHGEKQRTLGRNK